jgi:PPM family protein phosphatase
MSERAVLEVASQTHPGLVRSHNEDAVFVDVDKGLVLLADGMGGYNAGEVASGIAIDLISRGLLERLEPKRPLHKIDQGTGLTHAAAMMLQQIEVANQGIWDAAQARPECAGMGTTLVAALYYTDRICIAHIGDSRCYRMRQGKLEQLTHDHSLLQEQIDLGLITEEQAKFSLHKNLLTRALGIDETVEIEVNEYRLEADDLYLFCSDGLTDMVETDALAQIMLDQDIKLRAKTERMIELANAGGGRDNISVILVRIPPDYLPNEDAGAWWQRWVAGTGPDERTKGEKRR